MYHCKMYDSERFPVIKAYLFGQQYLPEWRQTVIFCSCKILHFVLFNSDKYPLAKSPVFRLLETTPRLAECPRLCHQLLQQHVKGDLFIRLLQWIQDIHLICYFKIFTFAYGQGQGN